MELNLLALLKKVFINSVTKVKPKYLIKNNVRYDPAKSRLHIFEDYYDLKNRSVSIVGAGKAVLQMATEMESILGKKLSSGVISVPKGILKEYNVSPTSVLQYMEGAENNVADENSLNATTKIKHFLATLEKNTLLVVLLSGGGSALLPDPVHPISIQEKSNLITRLSMLGADIKELNTVRKKLSSIKGGKLALLAHPAEIVSLIISDIVGVCPGMVASGPTFRNEDPDSAALDIVNKYIGPNNFPTSIFNVLSSKGESNDDLWNSINVSNYVLGNNVVLIDWAFKECSRYGYQSYHISHTVSGSVEQVAEEYCLLALAVCGIVTRHISLDQAECMLKSLTAIPFSLEVLNELLQIKMQSDGVCLVSGGEPVVKVMGKGKGGRNQHLALLFSYIIHLKKQQHSLLNLFDIYLLSAGSDGIDGPTDAAGAIGSMDLYDDAMRNQLDIALFLKNNDSYNFYSTFKNGLCHIKTGHTNTNVMDLHLIVIKPKLPNKL